jgi:hypothetical protein
MIVKQKPTNIQTSKNVCVVSNTTEMENQNTVWRRPTVESFILKPMLPTTSDDGEKRNTETRNNSFSIAAISWIVKSDPEKPTTSV